MIVIPNKPSFRPDEAGMIFEVTRKTIYLWIEHGKLSAVKVGGSIRIPRESMIALQKEIDPDDLALCD